MSIECYLTAYKDLSEFFGKTRYTSEYIEHQAAKFKANIKDDGILIETFESFKSKDPYRVDISPEAIEKEYWRRYRSEKGNDSAVVKKVDLSPCEHGLCELSSKGVIFAVKGRYTNTFICPCSNLSDSKYPVWMKGGFNNGFVLERDLNEDEYEDEVMN